MITINKEEANQTGQHRYIVSVYAMAIGWYTEGDLAALDSWRRDLIAHDRWAIRLPDLRDLSTEWKFCEQCGKPFPFTGRDICGVCFVVNYRAAELSGDTEACGNRRKESSTEEESIANAPQRRRGK